MGGVEIKVLGTAQGAAPGSGHLLRCSRLTLNKVTPTVEYSTQCAHSMSGFADVQKYPLGRRTQIGLNALPSKSSARLASPTRTDLPRLQPNPTPSGGCVSNRKCKATVRSLAVSFRLALLR